MSRTKARSNISYWKFWNNNSDLTGVSPMDTVIKLNKTLKGNKEQFSINTTKGRLCLPLLWPPSIPPPPPIILPCLNITLLFRGLGNTSPPRRNLFWNWNSKVGFRFPMIRLSGACCLSVVLALMTCNTSYDDCFINNCSQDIITAPVWWTVKCFQNISVKK